MDISDRKKQTLRYIVEAYISGGEPVGSKYLTDTKKLSWSSATVRNDMMELEKSGYLYQPHTSAGRVPTTAGYQAYVNELMDEYKMTVNEVDAINKLLTYKVTELDKIVESIGKIASHLSNYTAITVQPGDHGVSADKFEIIRLDDNNIVLVTVTSVSKVVSCHLRLPCKLSENDANKLKELLNMYLTGITPSSINLPLINELENAMGNAAGNVMPIIRCLSDSLKDIDGGNVEFEGVTNLLKYPEFYDNDSLSGIINLPNQKDMMIELLSNDENSAIKTVDGVNILIGSDDDNGSPIKDYSIVYKNFDAGNGLKGTLGIIGPKRMEYSKVIAHLKYLTSKLQNMITFDSSVIGLEEHNEN